MKYGQIITDQLLKEATLQPQARNNISNGEVKTNTVTSNNSVANNKDNNVKTHTQQRASQQSYSSSSNSSTSTNTSLSTEIESEIISMQFDQEEVSPPAELSKFLPNAFQFIH